MPDGSRTTTKKGACTRETFAVTRRLFSNPAGKARVDTRPTCPPVTVRSGRDGLDPNEVGGTCDHRRSVGSARYASPGRRMDSTAWPNGYVHQRPE